MSLRLLYLIVVRVFGWLVLLGRIDCEVTGLVGIYTDPRHVILYTSDGEARQEFSIVLTARATGGEPTRSEESSEVRWVARVELGGYAMDRSMRLRIGHYLEGRAAPYLG